MPGLLKDNQLVLFQGDSVTDCGRSRADDSDYGRGYVNLIVSMISAGYPQSRIRFINRGISGNRVKDLKDRWKQDCLDIKPDWVSILIGINDCWRRYDRNDATSAEEYEIGYRDILKRTVKETDARLILCEPFVLPVSEDRKKWREDLDPKIQVVRQLALEFKAIYIPYDGIFARASAEREPAYWARDGVHPSLAGHGLMALEWLKAVHADG